VFILVSLLLVLGGATAALAVEGLPFTDISGHWAEQAIENLAARGIIAGHADGTFGPDEVVTRAQVATFLDRLNTEAMTPVEAKKGCPDCHVGSYSLKNEAVGAAAAVHSILADDATVTTCLVCHAPGLGAQAGKGNAAPLSLRDIVHPVHMGSKIFSIEYLGDCLTCHSVSSDGTFEVISLDGSASGHPLPLTGGHAGVTCAQCHSLNPTSVACVNCHGDNHKGLTDCTRCHSVAGWKPANFTHVQVGKHVPTGSSPLTCVQCHPSGFATNSCSCHANHPLALTGGHAGVTCAQCHSLNPTSVACVNCHGDNHKGLTDCTRCHSVAGWKPANFTHVQVGDHMPSGKEPVPCSGCHPSGFGSNSCTPCHDSPPKDD
jgi:hypothetical protein